MGASRYLSIGAVSLAGVLTLFILQAFFFGTWLLENGQHLEQLSAEFLPVPIAFLLWVRCMEKSEKFNLSFSPFFCALAMEAYVALFVIRAPAFTVGILLVAVLAGFFILVPFGEALGRLISRPREALILTIAATAAANYYWLTRVIWVQIVDATAHVVYAVLYLFDNSIVINTRKMAEIEMAGIEIYSGYFNILVNPSCSGLEGIFLFAFMLSVMLLIDWDLFKRRSILLLYALGVILMFFVNALRITAFFTVGYWAYRPDAWEWVQSLKGAPVFLFHSYVGWVFYLIAFGLFAGWMYRRAQRNTR